MVDCRSDDITSEAKHLLQLVQETPRRLLVARALDQKDRCKTDVGLIPSCDKGRFFLSQLSVQTLPQPLCAIARISPCVQSHASAPVCNRTHQPLCAIARISTCVQSHASAPVCNRTHQHLCACYKSPTPATIPLSGHTKIWHTLTRMGNAVLAAAVAWPK